jgi:hypothetical protein
MYPNLVSLIVTPLYKQKYLLHSKGTQLLDSLSKGYALLC